MTDYEGAPHVAADVMIGAGAIDSAAVAQFLKAMTWSGKVYLVWRSVERMYTWNERPDHCIVRAFMDRSEAQKFASDCTQLWTEFLHKEDLRQTKKLGLYVVNSARSTGSDSLHRRVDRLLDLNWVHPLDPGVKINMHLVEWTVSEPIPIGRP